MLCCLSASSCSCTNCCTLINKGITRTHSQLYQTVSTLRPTWIRTIQGLLPTYLNKPHTFFIGYSYPTIVAYRIVVAKTRHLKMLDWESSLPVFRAAQAIVFFFQASRRKGLRIRLEQQHKQVFKVSPSQFTWKSARSTEEFIVEDVLHYKVYR